MTVAEPAARRVTRSQVTVAKPASGKKVTADKQTSVRAASGGRTNRTATATTSTSVDKPSSATQAKVGHEYVLVVIHFLDCISIIWYASSSFGWIQFVGDECCEFNKQNLTWVCHIRIERKPAVYNLINIVD